MDTPDGLGGGGGALPTWKSYGEGGSSSFGNPGGWGGVKKPCLLSWGCGFFLE